jgi:predicted RNase H-like HicB family nuclease
MKGNGAVKIYQFAAVIEKDEDGYYAFCPELQGCYTSGETFEEARANLADAIRLHVMDRLAAGEEVRVSESINLTTVQVAV